MREPSEFEMQATADPSMFTSFVSSATPRWSVSSSNHQSSERSSLHSLSCATRIRVQGEIRHRTCAQSGRTSDRGHTGSPSLGATGGDGAQEFEPRCSAAHQENVRQRAQDLDEMAMRGLGSRRAVEPSPLDASVLPLVEGGAVDTAHSVSVPGYAKSWRPCWSSCRPWRPPSTEEVRH